MKPAMKKIQPLLLATTLMVVACGGNSAPKGAALEIVQPKEYTYTIVNTYPHLETSYTQGLQWVDGELWEGTGEQGRSVLQRVDLTSGRAEVVARLPKEDFGEGITLLNGKVYQLTWQSNKAYVYDASTGLILREHRYAGEGWGLTTDGKHLYFSNGSAKIYTINPDTFKRTGDITVTLRGEALGFINEMEWIDGKIWANVYTTDMIAIIEPSTGVVEGLVDLQNILPEADKTPATDVLNGIAYDAATRRIFVTGKNWRRLYEITIIEK